MQQREPRTETIAAKEARARWGQLLARVARRDARVVVEEGGVPVAALISAEDLERLERFEAQRNEDLRVLEASWKAFEAEDPERVEREIARAIAEVRAERRDQR